MNAIRKLLVMMLAIAIGIGTSIAVCIKGWGLQPQSWWWIVGVYLIGQIVSLTIAEIAKRDDE